MRVCRFLLLAGFATGVLVRADIVNLVNGDRFTGSVELVNAKEVQLKGDSIGTISVPRTNVASIYFGTNQPSGKLAGATKDPSASGPFDAKAIEKVQDDFLATAGPEANAMFKDLVQSLASGKLNIEDIRNQARDSLKELKELQADVGEDADNPLLQSYVGILEQFINKGSTNRAKIEPPKKPTAAAPEKKAGDE
jgi:hypothetical protein